MYILGFGIELMTEIARYLQFNVTFKLVDDGKYGSINEHGRWNGMIKEVKKYNVFIFTGSLQITLILVPY